MDKAELTQAIAGYLDSHAILNLATAGPDGAHATSVFYARRNFELFWFSEPDTRHSRHIARNSGCAGTITDNVTDYAKIQGLQLRGVAEEMTDASTIRLGQEALIARYAFLSDFSEGSAMEKVSIYRFRPLSITWIDNTVSFGFKQTLDFEN